MINTLEQIARRFEELNALLSRPDIAKNQVEYQKLTKEHSEIGKTYEAYLKYKDLLENIDFNKVIIEDKSEDPGMIELAKEELSALLKEKGLLEEELKVLLIPKDPLDDKNVILEIRAGTGGDEAGLFAADLYRMYSKFAENNNWKIEVMSNSVSDKGGLKEIISVFTGRGVYKKLKFESGTHRVQRVPETETQGRIHTSAATVAILPEAEEVDIEIDPNEIRVDVFRSSGHGGQSVNTTDSAVRITHLETGIVVSMQDEKSQHKNRAKALKILRSRLMDKKQAEVDAERSKHRRTQVGTGDRSQRIRTYNFPQGRLTDHRIGLTLYKLSQIMEGELDEIIENLILKHQAELLTADD